MATEKQKKAIGLLVENGGNVSKSMRQAGYSEKTAKTPKKLTESDAFKKFADSLPDDLLIKVHLEGLNATKHQGVGGMVLNVEKKEFGHTEVEVPDFPTRHKYLDSAYKIKGAYATEKVDVTSAGEQITIDEKQYSQLVRAAAARATNEGSGA